MTSAFSWQSSVSLCHSSFYTPRPNLPVALGIFWLPIFAFHSPMMKRISFFDVLEGLVGLYRTVQLQPLWHRWLGHRLGLLWCWMVCFANESRSFCHFWDCAQVLHFRLFCWLWCYSISSKGFLPTVVGIMVISVKFTHFSPPVHQFTDSSLIIFPFSSFWLSQDSWVS